MKKSNLILIAVIVALLLILGACAAVVGTRSRYNDGPTVQNCPIGQSYDYDDQECESNSHHRKHKKKHKISHRVGSHLKNKIRDRKARKSSGFSGFKDKTSKVRSSSTSKRR